MSVRIHKASVNQRKRLDVDLSQGMAQVVELLESRARDSVRNLVEALFDEEVRKLAGRPYARGRIARGLALRSGSDRGSVLFDGQRIQVRKPRLKLAGKEVHLESYRALRDWNLLTAKVVEHMVCGVSTRDYNTLLAELSGGLGLSKSSVSRAFKRGSRKVLQELQGRDLRAHRFIAVMIDGIHFASRNVTVALGINAAGERVVIGLKEGSTESAAVCTDMLQEAIARGLDSQAPFVFVIDGGKGIRRSIRDVFGESAWVQRCRVHKARNILEYLPERWHVEFRRRWARLRFANRYSEAKTELDHLNRWLSTISESAANSLEEAGDELLTVVKLGANPFLRRTLVTTNLIENIFSQVRYSSIRVKNWRKAPDQALRWSAVLLKRKERQMNRIHGYSHCPEFAEKLQQMSLANQGKVA